jgi:excinuclease ABC subunit A
MNYQRSRHAETFEIFPVGYVRTDSGRTYLEILEPYIPALKELEHFSHVQVFWWFSEFQDKMCREITQSEPLYEAPVTGVFASRSPTRPNPIGLTTAEIVHVDHKKGIVDIVNIDAYDGTPILDLKAHIPVQDRVKDVGVPEWTSHWPEWMPEEGIGLEEDEEKLNSSLKQESEVFEIFPVGYVQRNDGKTSLNILEAFIPALKQLEHFSHVRVLWWFHRLQDDRFRRATQNTPPYENAPVTGVFASRSPVRPNPIGLTTAKIVNVDHERGVVEIAGIDAYDKTPIVDLKAYVPSCDRMKNFRVPKWIAHWPAWHQGFEEAEIVDADNLRPADSDLLAAFQFVQPESTPPCSEAIDAVLPPRRGELEGGNSDTIIIRGARQHNLKNIDVTIPREKFTVITGVSGSGKSSLAFDTLYAEGRRRYVGSLSTLARRLVGQMEKPKVDHILGLVPTIAIGQGTVSRNPRSTVGTVTEVQDYLRVLFARIGTRHCPQCGRAIKPQTARRIADQLAALIPGTRFRLLAPVVRGREGIHTDVLQQALRDGYTQVRADGKMCDLEAGQVTLAEAEPHTIERVIGDFQVPSNEQVEFRDRLFDAVETGLKAGNGYLTVVLESGEEVLLSQHTVCPHCDIFFFELSPALFSFNNPDGMCSDCNGLGVKLSVDPELVVTDPDLSLLDGASPWYGELRKVKPSGNWMRSELFALADHMQVDLELPWRELPQSFREAALYGTGDEIIRWSYDMKKRGRSISFERPVQGAVNNIKRLLQQTQSEGARRRLLEFMREQPCPTCGGERLCAEARFVTVGGTRFPEVASMTLAQVHRWVGGLLQRLTPEQRQIASEIVEELEGRLESLLNVGLHYLALERPAPTLSGGEGQRIRLATQLGCGLTGLLYILDEPSIGLHRRDHQSLLDTLTRLKDAGNTVVVVEHDEDTMRAADWLIDLGPGAGTLGGEVVAVGTPEAVMADPDSLTGRYLSGGLRVVSPNGRERREPQGWLTVVGARLHNLKEIDVRFPLGLMTCVTGVSGSGKSSLVAQTLSPALARVLHGAQDTPGPHDRIEGLDQVDKVINIDQSPIGRTPRSNPGTYVGVFDKIRKVFAETAEAKARRYKARRFSFNAKEGRCEVCEGHGRRRIEMHFLPDVWVTCSECEGRRFNRQTLEIAYKNKSIADVLDMDIEEALEFFADHPKIVRILQTLHDVGLGYVKLGQSALTLSGGEAQRVKLAKELSRADTGRTLYILDEPTTGLHFADIQKLLDVLHRLTEAGNTVIVIEHNLDVIKTADWIVDLGPEGGDEGGHIVAQGTPEEVTQVTESYTGQFLRRVL